MKSDISRRHFLYGACAVTLPKGAVWGKLASAAPKAVFSMVANSASPQARFKEAPMLASDSGCRAPLLFGWSMR